MTDSVHSAAAVAVDPIAIEPALAALATLREQGVDRRNPVEFHYLETLALRLHDQDPQVQQILVGKLAQAVSSYQAAYPAPAAHLATSTSNAPQVSNSGATPLGQLVQSIAQRSREAGPGSSTAPESTHTELKSVRNHRNTWSTLSAHKQVSQALGQAPKNAGPINSHSLVLRSLALMRDISPDYLNRFMSYADTLLCLDSTDLTAKRPAAKQLAPAKPKARSSTRP